MEVVLLLCSYVIILSLSAMLAGCGDEAKWYDGIDSIKVFSPKDDVGSYAASLYWKNMEQAQFSDKRYSILLKRGDYSGHSTIPVGYYTSLQGVGDHPDDVIIDSFLSKDNPHHVNEQTHTSNACDNFWRHAEAVTTTNSSVTWASSQASPLRRVHVRGDLWLSEKGKSHWSSGGLLADSTVDGLLEFGTQQQFLVRNAVLKKGTSKKTSMNFVFVGSAGSPDPANSSGAISVVTSTPRKAAKPYLHEHAGKWSIVVPSMETDVIGITDSPDVDRIDLKDVYVAREGDTAAQINSGIISKKALLLSPAIYGLEESISINKTGFVVLGMGFATLVPYRGNAAITVHQNAKGVRIASVILEAGTPVTYKSSEPLLTWSGDDGIGADIFTRVGAFSYSRSFKPSCLKTRADSHIEINGSGTTLDHIWTWHADHDDCGGASDQSSSTHGLVVRGNDVVVYGLFAEHTLGTIVEWYGNLGQVYMFQSELPYHVDSYPGSGAYMVDNSVQQHKGVGMGVYQISGYTVDTGLRVPPTADMTNVFIWSITGSAQQFRSVICIVPSGMPGWPSCMGGDQCSAQACYQYHTGSGRDAAPAIAV
jgi:hypothetical protein